MPEVDIDLTDPHLGSQLLKDARGKLPVLVWKAYIERHDRKWGLVFQWLDRSEPDSRPIEAQKAVDQAVKLLHEEIMDCVVFSRRDPAVHAKAVHVTYGLLKLLTRASSSYRKRGQPPTMRPIAVRAYVIRKFNPHPTKADESSVSWAKLADLLFLENGRCPRKNRGEHGTNICHVTRHQYDSPCVKALITAVNHLYSAMKRDGIPI